MRFVFPLVEESFEGGGAEPAPPAGVAIKELQPRTDGLTCPIRVEQVGFRDGGRYPCIRRVAELSWSLDQGVDILTYVDL